MSWLDNLFGLGTKIKATPKLDGKVVPVLPGMGKGMYKGIGAGSSTSPKPTPTPTPEMTAYEKMTAPTFDQYKVPRAVAFGVGAGENGSNNRFNIGAGDSRVALAPKWDELTAATKAAKLFSGKANPGFYGNGETGRQQFEAANNLGTPSAVLHGIQQAGFAGDPNTWKARSVATGGAGTIYNSWEDFIMATPAWKKWAPK